MEGPSIVIATHELEEFIGLRILRASGTSKLNWDKFTNKKLLAANSWGKHLILSFEHLTLRIHFLMFGSYRIDNPRENRIPKMKSHYQLTLPSSVALFVQDTYLFFYLNTKINKMFGAGG